ncbi:hypothetical protein EA797_15310 [Stutzerimonas zhaodongensis]|uniref:Uncharacterized protein n=1 Tax=Stutzerimonas zhaodongensis TaxID=1176257 RepID=A0A3M2HJW6_9GAMM|nr:hypothetical protein EA797_15310 [Stutzerimonas zhaodongensis]
MLAPTERADRCAGQMLSVGASLLALTERTQRHSALAELFQIARTNNLGQIGHRDCPQRPLSVPTGLKKMNPAGSGS